ncbi:MAG: glycosyltransferase [Bacteroidetes bacterium]|nr:MAG: glycosyltransferase [Bacteroidota bacterium]
MLLISRFDLVCSIDLDTILPGFLVARLRRKIQVYDAHEYFTELPEVVHRPLVRGIWRLVARLTIPRIRYAYTVGESLARIFEKNYGTPFEVIRNVPFAQKTPPANFDPQKTSPPILLYQGALNDGRGLEAIIEALPGIPDALLWLVGEGDLSEKLRAMANARSDLRQRIRFWGYQKPEDLRNITPQATLGLNLLENKGLNYYYSLANKAFDYIQAGLPSANMQFPEYQRINEQAGVFLLVPDLRVSTLQDAINGLLSDPHRYRQMRENCIRAAARFTWEKEEKKLLDFYRKTGV